MMWSTLLVVLLAFALSIGILAFAHQWANLRYAQRGLVILNFIFHGLFAVTSIVIGCWGAANNLGQRAPENQNIWVCQMSQMRQEN